MSDKPEFWYQDCVLEEIANRCRANGHCADDYLTALLEDIRAIDRDGGPASGKWVFPKRAE